MEKEEFYLKSGEIAKIIAAVLRERTKQLSKIENIEQSEKFKKLFEEDFVEILRNEIFKEDLNKYMTREKPFGGYPGNSMYYSVIDGGHIHPAILKALEKINLSKDDLLLGGYDNWGTKIDVELTQGCDEDDMRGWPAVPEKVILSSIKIIEFFSDGGGRSFRGLDSYTLGEKLNESNFDGTIASFVETLIKNESATRIMLKLQTEKEAEDLMPKIKCKREQLANAEAEMDKISEQLTGKSLKEMAQTDEFRRFLSRQQECRELKNNLYEPEKLLAQKRNILKQIENANNNLATFGQTENQTAKKSAPTHK